MSSEHVWVDRNIQFDSGVNEIEILFSIQKVIKHELQIKNWKMSETPHTLHFNRKSTIWIDRINGIDE